MKKLITFCFLVMVLTGCTGDGGDNKKLPGYKQNSEFPAKTLEQCSKVCNGKMLVYYAGAESTRCECMFERCLR